MLNATFNSDRSSWAVVPTMGKRPCLLRFEWEPGSDKDALVKCLQRAAPGGAGLSVPVEK